MKKGLVHLAVLAALLLTGITATAQSVPDKSEWSFSSTRVEIDGQRYHLDNTNKLAEFLVYYTSQTSAEAMTGTLTVPATVSYGNESYTVVSMKEDGWSYDLPNITEVVLPNTLVNLGDYALAHFTKASTVEVPASVKYVGTYLLNREYASVHFLGVTPPEVKGKLSSSNKVKVYVPADGFAEYKMADYIEDCCVVCDDLSKHTYQTGTVDSGQLGYIVVANQLPEIITFSDVNKLVANAGTFDEEDWYQLRQMKNLVCLDLSGMSITEVPAGALKNCWQIETVILPPTLEAIRSEAFRYTGVRDLILPSGMTEITGSYNFSDCDFLTSIVIPDGVTSLPTRCFYDCDNLQQVTLSPTTESLGEHCFSYCDLTSLVLPGTLKTTPYYGFYNNTNMASLTLKEGIETIGSCCFEECNKLTSVDFPRSVRCIRSYAFRGIDDLSEINLNEGLEEIDDYAFSGTPLTEVALPSSLIYCLYSPFSDCNQLTKISCSSLIPPTVRSQVPTGKAGNIELYVPLWSFQEYMTTPGWLEYQDHTAIDPDILPENIVINKEFSFVLKPEQMKEGYNPNLRMLYNTEEIDDNFGHQKYERGNLSVSSSSVLNVNDFTMYMSPMAKFYSDMSRFRYDGYNYDYSRTQYSPNSLIVRGQMRAENQTYTLMLGNDTWQFISFPFDVMVSDIQPVDALTQWVIRKYDGAARAAQDFDNTWVNVAQDEMLVAGRGYVIKCYNSDSKYNKSTYSIKAPVEFTLSPVKNTLNYQKLFNSNDCQVALDENTSEFEQNRSWNLIGNPYPCYFDSRYMDTASPFLVWNSWNGTYAAFSPVDDDYVFEPGEAFFIQRPVNDGEQLNFRQEGRQTYRNPNDLTVTEARALMTAGKSQRTVVNLQLSDGEQNDHTRVVFNDDALMKYEVSRDAAKFAAEGNVPQLWSVGGSVKYAINERPAENGIVELAVNCPQQGLYTLSLGQRSSVDAIVLEDRAMNVRTLLSDSEDYTFSIDEAGPQTGRFFIVAANDVVTAISSVKDAPQTDCYYNLNGQRVSASQRGLVIKNGKKVMK